MHTYTHIVETLMYANHITHCAHMITHVTNGYKHTHTHTHTHTLYSINLNQSDLSSLLGSTGAISRFEISSIDKLKLIISRII